MRFYSIRPNLAILSALLGCGIAGVAAQDTIGSGDPVPGIERPDEKAIDQPDSGADSRFADAGPRADQEKLGKRAGPPEVEPVIIDSIKFIALHWGKSRGLGQNGGYIAAYDASTGEELWILKVYEIIYDPQKEQDVQDIFIQSLEKTDSGDELLVTDEHDRTYIVDPATRTARPR